MRSLDEFATAKLAELERDSLRRELVETMRVTGIWMLRNGRRLLSFLLQRLSQSDAPSGRGRGRSPGFASLRNGCRSLAPRHRQPSALCRAGASRLAQLKQAQAACVFGSGYLANLGIIPALIGPEDLILIDELAHACLWGGARLSRAAVVPYRHADLGHVEVLLCGAAQTVTTRV